MGKEGSFGEVGCTGSRFNYEICFVFTLPIIYSSCSARPTVSSMSLGSPCTPAADSQRRVSMMISSHDHTEP